MEAINSYRLRKCSDIEMDNPYFEVLDENEVIIFDISKTDDGELSILFYEGVSAKYMSLLMLNKILDDVKNEFE